MDGLLRSLARSCVGCLAEGAGGWFFGGHAHARRGRLALVEGLGVSGISG